MATSADTLTRRVLLLAAHPGDEIGIAVTLRDAVLAGDEVWAVWLAKDDRELVAAKREREGRRAAELVGIDSGRERWGGLLPLALIAQLPELVGEVGDQIDEIQPDLVYVPAYEGGHPDHDAVNLAAFETAVARGIPTWEYPIYNASQPRFPRSVPVFGRFAPGPSEPAVRWLTYEETAFKRELWRCYPSQRPLMDVLLMLSGDEREYFTAEKTRSLAMRDYAKPPHEGPLLYERHGDIRFADFADAVRRYQWGGGVRDDGL